MERHRAASGNDLLDAALVLERASTSSARDGEALRRAAFALATIGSRVTGEAGGRETNARALRICAETLVRARSSRFARDRDVTLASWACAVYVYRALGVRANRSDGEGLELCAKACTLALDVDDAGDDGLRWEIAAFALGGLARAMGGADGVAAEKLEKTADGGRMLGAALARWTALRSTMREAESSRELKAADLARLCAIVSKSPDGAAAMGFCDCGGVQALLALIDVGDEESSDGREKLTSAAIFDVAKALAGFCSASSKSGARFDATWVRNELSAILASASGKISDPLPAVAATLLRQAVSSLEKRQSSGSSARQLTTALEREASGYLNIGDCRPALGDVGTTNGVGVSKSFGSRIELVRSLSSSDLSPVKAASSFGGSADSLSTPLTRKRSSSGLLHSKSGKSPTKARATRARRSRLRLLIALSIVTAVCVLLFIRHGRRPLF
ncbi:hypothetical protein BE221DRAFT_195378 [Ostreococcus tauri]|uniref:Uncharacterized protein n=1 Tax=Ostreococcus tauri TaxID=70448 RepID=A0A1Y5I8J2_OSTTA|nr:hypothetical protein BE221DRAFT_195378 [Ostreococcus tauri]